MQSIPANLKWSSEIPVPVNKIIPVDLKNLRVHYHHAQNRRFYKDVLKTFAALKYIKDEANPDLAKQRVLAWLISREEAQNRLLKEFIQFSDQNPFTNIASRR